MALASRFIMLCVGLGLCIFSAAQSDSALYKTNIFLPPDSCLKNSLLYVAAIKINGNKRTKGYIIDREIPFKTGDYIHESDIRKEIEKAREQIVNTQLFVDVQVYISKRQNDLIYFNVDVKERWYLFPLPYFKLVDRNFNEWWVQDKASLDRVNYGLKFTQNNVSGRNDNLNIFLINGYNREVDIKYIQPFADKNLKNGYEFSLIYSGQHQIDYGTDLSKPLTYQEGGFASHLLKVEASYLYRPRVKTRHSFSIGYIDAKISDSAFNLNHDYFSHNLKDIRYPTFVYTIQYVDVDNIAYPTKGFLGDFSFIKSGISRNINLWQLQTHLSYTIPIVPKVQLQFTAGGILKMPFQQPFYNRQLFGYGDIYLQGLEYYVIDGVAGGVLRTTLRRQMFAFNLDTHLKSKTYHHIPFRFYFKTYGNLGYAYNPDPGNSLLNNKLLRTGGFGLDIVTIYDIAFKIEYSFNQLGGQGIFIHTGQDF